MAEMTLWHPARLQAVRDLTADIRLFRIEPVSGFRLPTPGSHIQVAVQVPGAGGIRPDVRSYSTVGPCADGVYQIAVKRLVETRGGSAYLWGLEAGALMSTSAPRNRFELARGRAEYLLVAGGIGITPIHGMALALAGAGARFRVLYAARGRGDFALAEEMRAVVGERLETFVGAEGRRLELGREIARLAPGGEVYVCGPIGLLEAAKRAWRESGRPIDGLRFETFGSSGRYAAEAFTVDLPRLGLSIDVSPQQTLLDALEAAGVETIYDCRRGECGLCALPILGAGGEIDHRDVFFSEEEKAANRKLCTCVSRAVGGRISLDTGHR